MSKKMYAIVMSFFVFCSIGFGKDIFGREVRVEKTEYSVEKDCIFELNGENGDVEIASWNSDKIYVEVKKIAKKEKDFDKIRAIVENKEGVFKIYTEIDKNASNVSIDYVIKVPKTLKSVEVYCENGDIELSKIKTLVKLSSENGNIQAENMGIIENVANHNGDIDIADALSIENIESENGSIDLKNVENIGTVSMKSGDINITDAVSVKKVESKNGNIEIEMDRITGQMELVNINGKIEIEISDDLEGTIEFSTVNGSVDIDDFDVEYMNKSWNGVEGRIGSGSNKLTATNINGSIELSKK